MSRRGTLARPAPPEDAPSIQRCAVHLLSGSHLSDGLAVVIQRGDRSEIRVTELSSPGTLLTALFGHNIMQYRLAFQDGRILRAELTGTAWGPTGRRLCTFHAI